MHDRPRGYNECGLQCLIDCPTLDPAIEHIICSTDKLLTPH